MTYFTDSVYEKMMVQKPKYGREKKSPANDSKKVKKRIGSDCSKNNHKKSEHS